jgi:hypothetical protein
MQRPALERWLSIDLVVETFHTMAAWQDTAAALAQLMERSGGFRVIRRWQWDAVGDTHGGLGRKGGMRTTRGRLPEGVGPRLVIVLSDCLSRAWEDGSALACLARWGATDTVALLQVLPALLWERTGLGNVPDSYVTGGIAGTPNARLTIARPEMPVWVALAETPPGTDVDPHHGMIAVPVVSLDPDHLIPWARLVAGRAAPPVYAVLVGTLCSDGREGLIADADATAWMAEGRDEIEDSASPPEQNEDDLIEEFWGYASPEARFLAGCLTVTSPVTLGAMRAIRDAMVPHPREVQIAEILMSGFLRPTSSDTTVYAWVGGIRERLGSGLRADHRSKVRRAVGRWMKAHPAPAQEMMAFVPDPLGESGLSDASADGHVAEIPVEGGSTEGFLRPSAIASEAVNHLGQSEQVLDQLLFFATDTQHSWLIRTSHHLVIILDDPTTRKTNNLVQRSMRLSDASPVRAKVDDGRSTVGFGSEVLPPWYYSSHLYTTPSEIETAIRSLLRLTLEYDSDTELLPFSSWGQYAIGRSDFRIGLEEPGRYYLFSSLDQQNVGLNKSIGILKGVIKFQYKANSNLNENVVFYAIPMRGDPQRDDLLEVGGAVVDDPRNEFSKLRVRLPGVTDGGPEWKPAELRFNFQGIRDATYTIFGPRINEGCSRRGPAVVMIRHIKVVGESEGAEAPRSIEAAMIALPKRRWNQTDSSTG